MVKTPAALCSIRHLVIWACDLTEGDRGKSFVCLECGGILSPVPSHLRRLPGSEETITVASHFKHLPGEGIEEGGVDGGLGCGEGSLHKAAKRLLIDNLYNWKIRFQCGVLICLNTWGETFDFGPEWSASSEKTLTCTNGKNYNVDVWTTNSYIEMVFEILVSHPIGYEKRRHLVAKIGKNHVFEVEAAVIHEAVRTRKFELICKGDAFCERCTERRIRTCKDCRIEFDIEAGLGGPIQDKRNLYFFCDNCGEKCRTCGAFKSKAGVCLSCEQVAREREAIVLQRRREEELQKIREREEAELRRQMEEERRKERESLMNQEELRKYKEILEEKLRTELRMERDKLDAEREAVTQKIKKEQELQKQQSRNLCLGVEESMKAPLVKRMKIDEEETKQSGRLVSEAKQKMGKLEDSMTRLKRNAAELKNGTASLPLIVIEGEEEEVKSKGAVFDEKTLQWRVSNAKVFASCVKFWRIYRYSDYDIITGLLQ